MTETHPHHHPQHSAASGGAKDPVCGMTVDPATAKHQAEHQGHTYYFCCNGCRTKFEADPQKYLAPEAEAPKQVSKGAEYTGPMHPEIRQGGPAACPTWFMALEPLIAAAEIAANYELIAMTPRFWFGLA